MEFSRQGYWSGLLFSIPRDLPNPGIEPKTLVPPALAGGFFTTEAPGKPPLTLLKTLKQSATKHPSDCEVRANGHTEPREDDCVLRDKSFSAEKLEDVGWHDELGCGTTGPVAPGGSLSLGKPLGPKYQWSLLRKGA